MRFLTAKASQIRQGKQWLRSNSRIVSYTVMSTVLTLVAITSSVACARFYTIQTVNPGMYESQAETNLSTMVGRLASLFLNTFYWCSKFQPSSLQYRIDHPRTYLYWYWCNRTNIYHKLVCPVRCVRCRRRRCGHLLRAMSNPECLSRP